MAQRINVVVLCDIDDVEGAGTTSFAFRGNSYEIDLCDVHLLELEQVLEPFVLSGRRIGRAPRKTAVPARPTPPPPVSNGHVVAEDGKDMRTKVRQWAVDQGYDIGLRGRIPQDIYRLYQEAHA